MSDSLNRFQLAINSLRRNTTHATHVLREEGLASLLSKLCHAPGIVLRSTRCKRLLKTLKPGCSVEQLAAFVFDCRDLAPIQIRSELTGMLEVVQKLRPRTVVEIGTANGGTLLTLCRLTAEDGTIVSIDLPGGRFGGGYSAWRISLYQAFGTMSQKIELLRGDSHSNAMFGDLEHILAGRPVDFLFIDGDHTYEGVKRDFELYSPLVAQGGMIGFHDIAPISPTGDYGVRRFWEELKPIHTWQEIIANQNQRGYGIGLLRI